MYQHDDTGFDEVLHKDVDFMSSSLTYELLLLEG